jgi:hypothetical protein
MRRRTQEDAMKILAGALAPSIALLCGCGGQIDNSANVDPQALSEVRHGNPLHTVIGDAGRRTSSGNLIDHGGPVVPTFKLNLIFWGSGFESSTASLYESFLGGIGSSGYWTINNQYLRGATNATSFGAAFSDPSTPPGTVTDADLQAEVHRVLAAGSLSYSAESLYYVVTPKTVRVCSGSACSCTTFCGYHSSYADSTFGPVLYATIPSAAACPTACGIFASDAASPNGNVEADEGVSVLAHEGEETMTDPLASAWFDRRGNENADKCAFKYGTTTLAANGAEVNQSWSGHSWLVQTNWSNVISGCAEFGPTQ